jgi:hypothetical protein
MIVHTKGPKPAFIGLGEMKEYARNGIKCCV